MDVKLGILIFLNMAPPQKLVLAPGAIIRVNTVCICASWCVGSHRVHAHTCDMNMCQKSEYCTSSQYGTPLIMAPLLFETTKCGNFWLKYS